AIDSVLRSLSSHILNRIHTVMIIDNGSQDKSLEIAVLWAAEQRPGLVRVMRNSQNYSLGGSTIIALREAQQLGLDWLICMHTDGQAQAKDLVKIMTQIEADPTLDVVTGSRFLPASEVSEYPRLRKWGNL